MGRGLLDLTFNIITIFQPVFTELIIKEKTHLNRRLNNPLNSLSPEKAVKKNMKEMSATQIECSRNQNSDIKCSHPAGDIS